MKIYTKTGDSGSTALFGGTRVPKHHARIEAYGTIDELNAWMGLIRDQDTDAHTKAILLSIQRDLFTIGAMLAADPEKARLKSGKKRLNIARINPENIETLEKEIDAMNGHLPPLTHFILPGGHPTVSFCHIARTVCRRAERMITQLIENEPFDDPVLPYINRLSDYLFVLARKLAATLNIGEVKWIPDKEV